MEEFISRMITREHAEYESSRILWNRSLNFFPRGILPCENVNEVCMAVNYIRSQNAQCRIWTGGHSSSGFCTADDAYIIKLSGMSQCEYLQGYQMAKIGCACTCKSICSTLSAEQYFFPGANPFSCVGVWSLGGGLGCSSRRYGLGCDYIAQIEMVDYRGEVIIANANYNQDLFWACKGAGAGNFGIVTGITYYLPQPVDYVCYFEIRMEYCTRSSLIHYFEVWQDWISTLSVDINCQTSFCNTFHSGRYIFGYGVSYLSVEETKVCLGPLLQIKGLRITFESKTYLNVMSGLGKYYSPYERSNRFGRFCYDSYPIGEIEHIVDLIWNKRAEGSVVTSLTLTGMGGFISNYSNQSTAFFYRDARYLMSLKTEWFDEGCRGVNEYWLSRNCDYMCSITKGGYIREPYLGYQNYEQEYYGENLYWLKQVKAKYDPYNFFTFQQSLRL